MPPTTPSAPSASVSYTFLENGLVREITPAGTTPFGFSTSQPISFSSSILFLWTLGMVVCVAGTAFVIARGASYGIEASEVGIRKRNEEWRRGAFGLLGVMMLFLLVYTVNRGLLLNDVNLQALRQSGTPTTVGSGSGVASPAPVGAGGSSESDTRARLASANISINKAACTSGQTTDCTNVAGVSDRVIAMLLSLRQACPSCALVVTGGTEPGHSASGNHPRGQAVDLSKTSSLQSFLSNTSVCRPLSPGRCGWGGFTFYDEPSGANANTTAPHYHVD